MEGYCEKKNLLAKVLMEKTLLLQKKGVQLSFENFKDRGSVMDITIIGKNQKVFQVSHADDLLYLENPEHRAPGGRPVYSSPDDMASYLLIIANGGQITGVLMYPGTEEIRFMQTPAVPPT